MYGNISNASEQAPSLSYGINTISVVDIKVEAVATAKYNGDVMVVTFANANGAIHTKRHFPYAFNEARVNYTTKVPLTSAEQEKEYLSKIKHLYTKAHKGDDASFDAIMSGATDFKSFAALLKTATTGANGEFFRCKFIDKNGFPTIPDYTGGVAEKLTTNPSMLRFDPVKDGPKQQRPDLETGTADSADLPF